MDVTYSRLLAWHEIPGGLAPVAIALPPTLDFEHEHEGLRISGTLELRDERYGATPPTVVPEHQGTRTTSWLDLREERYGATRLSVEVLEGSDRVLTPDVLRAIPYGSLYVMAATAVHPKLIRREGDYDVLREGEFTPEERVVIAYYIARAAGENTNAVIAAELGITPSAAAQRVARLRKGDTPLLPPARTRGARR